MSMPVRPGVSPPFHLLLRRFYRVPRSARGYFLVKNVRNLSDIFGICVARPDLAPVAGKLGDTDAAAQIARILFLVNILKCGIESRVDVRRKGL